MTRDDLAAIPAGTEHLRAVRYITADDVTDITDEELEHAIRWMRAATHSARLGTIALERILAERNGPPCSP